MNEYTKTTKETIDKAIEICQETLLFRNLSKEKKQIITLTLQDNLDYCDDLVGWYYGNNLDEEDNDYSLTVFENSLAHDLSGLYRKDEHFVPRINNKTV